MPIQRNDRHDTDPHELTLIRAGHYLVYLSRRAGVTAYEKATLWEAAELIWEAKRAYRVDLAARRKAKADAWMARIKEATQ